MTDNFTKSDQKNILDALTKRPTRISNQKKDEIINTLRAIIYELTGVQDKRNLSQQLSKIINDPTLRKATQDAFQHTQKQHPRTQIIIETETNRRDTNMDTL